MSPPRARPRIHGLQWERPDYWRGKLHAYPPRKPNEKRRPNALCGEPPGAWGHNSPGFASERADPLMQCRKCAKIAITRSVSA